MKDALAAVKRHFPSVSVAGVVLRTKEFDICDGEFVDITAEAWEGVVNEISSVLVVDEKPSIPVTRVMPTQVISPPKKSLCLEISTFEYGYLTMFSSHR